MGAVKSTFGETGHCSKLHFFIHMFTHHVGKLYVEVNQSNYTSYHVWHNSAKGRLRSLTFQQIAFENTRSGCALSWQVRGFVCPSVSLIMLLLRSSLMAEVHQGMQDKPTAGAVGDEEHEGLSKNIGNTWSQLWTTAKIKLR